MLEVLHRTPNLIAIDKPAGMLVHRTALTGLGERENCVALLRAQLGEWVYPVHRLDRATSGVLVFALNAATAETLCSQYRERQLRKTYLALVRGHTPESGEISKPLRRNFEDTASEYCEALTRYRRVATAELPFAVGRYETARYSLLAVEPVTGRRHQIRRHLAGVSHPIIGDTVHGDGRHNRFFREQFNICRLLLHASRVEIPVSESLPDTLISSNSLHEFLEMLKPIIPDHINTL